MSMLDKLKNLVKGHEETSRQGVDKAADAIDRKTDSKYSDQVDTGQQKMDEQFGGGDRSQDRPPQP